MLSWSWSLPLRPREAEPPPEAPLRPRAFEREREVKQVNLELLRKRRVAFKTPCVVMSLTAHNLNVPAEVVKQFDLPGGRFSTHDIMPKHSRNKWRSA